jgi:hypothetical protein
LHEVGTIVGGLFLPATPDVVAGLQASDASMRVVQPRVLGGAVSRVPADATAYAHRKSRIMVNVAAFYDGAGERPARAPGSVERSIAAARPQTPSKCPTNARPCPISALLGPAGVTDL